MAKIIYTFEVRGDYFKTDLRNVTPLLDALNVEQYQKDMLRIAENLKAAACGLEAGAKLLIDK